MVHIQDLADAYARVVDADIATVSGQAFHFSEDAVYFLSSQFLSFSP